MTRRLVMAFALGLLPGLIWWPLVPLMGAGFLADRQLRPRLAHRRLERRRSESLAEVTDLVLVAVSAGGTTIGALHLVIARGPCVVAPAFADVIRRYDTGEPLPVALRQIGDVLGPDYVPLAVVLAQAEREGTPVALLLQRLGDEAARARRRNADIAARRLAVQALAPLVLCSLPAVIVGAIVPLVIVTLRHF